MIRTTLAALALAAAAGDGLDLRQREGDLYFSGGTIDYSKIIFMSKSVEIFRIETNTNEIVANKAAIACHVSKDGTHWSELAKLKLDDLDQIAELRCSRVRP